MPILPENGDKVLIFSGKTVIPNGGRFGMGFLARPPSMYNYSYMTCGRRVNILGVNVDVGYDIAGVMEKIETVLLQDGPHYICTTNPEFIMSAQNDPEFRDMINGADMSLPDGAGGLASSKVSTCG